MMEEGKNIFNLPKETFEDLLNKDKKRITDDLQSAQGRPPTEQEVEAVQRLETADPYPLDVPNTPVKGARSDRPDSNYDAKNDLHRLSREGLLGSKDDNNE